MAGLCHPTVAKASPTLAGRGLEILGLLPDAPPANHYVTGDGIMDVDPSTHRLYYLWRNGDVSPNVYYLREYDLGAAVPTVIRDIAIGVYGQGPGQVQIDNISPYFASVDTRRHTLYILAETETGPRILVIDLATGRVKAPMDVGSQVPGFAAEGITYSPRDDRLYLIGQLSGSYLVTVVDQGFGGPVPASVATVVAVSPQGAKVQWVYPVRQCQKVLDTFAVGALIAESARERALYFACSRAYVYPGEAGIVRLDLPRVANQAAFGSFRTSFFGISGYYSGNGIAAFDPKSDRFFMQSLAFSSPGAWVFDGRLGAWVGQIAAPDASDSYMGLNQGTGHYYMGSYHNVGQSKWAGYLTVADGRGTPVPQGYVVNGLNSQRFIATDPGSGRLFVEMDLGLAGLGKPGQMGWVVLRDRTPNQSPLRPLNYDTLTSDAPEGPNSITNFSGDVNGYGARTLLVGGAGGAISFPFTQGSPPSEVDSYDRGFTASAVPSVDLRASGASATAQAALLDNQSDSKYQSVRGQASQLPQWPWDPATCLNAGGKPLTQQKGDSSGVGQASVTCDLSHSAVDASASFGHLSSSGVSVASSSFDSRIRRDPTRGIVNHTSAEASGISISTPSGEVTIAHVTAEANTVAHGHPGTTEATWRRVLSGIEIVNGSGNKRSVPECETTLTQRGGDKAPRVQTDTCQQVAAEMNDALGVHARIDLFKPELDATPKGAFAGVQQTDAQYYEGRTVNSQGVVFGNENPTERPVPAMQITIYNDGTEHSRALLQLAAIQASSIYTISALGPAGPLPGVTTPTSGSSAPQTIPSHASASAPVTGNALAAPVVAEGPVTTVAAGNPTQSTSVSPAGSLAFVLRTPKEALAIAATLLLFACAGLLMARRQVLLPVLDGKEQ
jgi:hypothetical protein